MRRSTCGGSPATHRSRVPPASVSVHTVPRSPRRCTMRCGSPRSGTSTPCANGAAFGQALEPRGDPAAVLLCELLGLLDAAARRHGENHLARGGVDAQGVASRLAMPAQAHEIDRPVENHLNDRGLARTTIEQRAKRHRRKSTLEQPRAKYCHTNKRAQHERRQIKALPQPPGAAAIADYYSLGLERFESGFQLLRPTGPAAGSGHPFPAPRLLINPRTFNGLARIAGTGWRIAGNPGGMRLARAPGDPVTGGCASRPAPSETILSAAVGAAGAEPCFAACRRPRR